MGSRLVFLNINLIEAAKLNGIEMLGKDGDVVPFDAIIHRMIDENLVPKNNVQILKPSVIFRRANGTYRVILPAIVTPA
jgi:predicted RNA methylase